MGKCINHQNKNADLKCLKYEVFMCDDCIQCRDPEIYCKFRASCVIWFMVTERQSEAKISTRQKL